MLASSVYQAGAFLASLLVVQILGLSGGALTGGERDSMPRSAQQAPKKSVKPEDQVKLVASTYAQFEDRIKQLKGKVVVLDCWTFS